MKMFRLYVKRVSTVFLDVNMEAENEKEALKLTTENAKNGEYTKQFQHEEQAGNFDDNFSAKFYYKTNNVLKREGINLQDLNELCEKRTVEQALQYGDHAKGSCRPDCGKK